MIADGWSDDIPGLRKPEAISVAVSDGVQSSAMKAIYRCFVSVFVISMFSSIPALSEDIYGVPESVALVLPYLPRDTGWNDRGLDLDSLTRTPSIHVYVAGDLVPDSFCRRDFRAKGQSALDESLKAKGLLFFQSGEGSPAPILAIAAPDRATLSKALASDQELAKALAWIINYRADNEGLYAGASPGSPQSRPEGFSRARTAILAQVDLYGGYYGPRGGTQMPIEYAGGQELTLDTSIDGGVQEVIQKKGVAIPVYLYSSSGRGAPPYQGRYDDGGRVVNLESQGASVALTSSIYDGGKVYLGGTIDRKGYPEAAYWVDGALRLVFKDGRKSAVAAIGILEGKLSLAGWAVFNGRAAPFLIKGNDVSILDASANDIYAWGAAIEGGRWLVAGVEEGKESDTLWLYGSDGKSRIASRPDFVLSRLRLDGASCLLCGTTNSDQGSYRVPFAYAGGKLTLFESTMADVEYFRVTDIARLPDGVVVAGNVKYKGEMGFGNHTLWTMEDSAILRLEKSGFLWRILPRTR